MMKRVLSDSFVYGIARVLMTAVGALLVPVYTKLLSRADYGVIETFNSLSAVVALVLPCGLMQALYRFAPPDENEARRTYATIFSFLVGLCAAFLAASVIFRLQITQWLVQDAVWVRVFVLTAISTVLGVLAGYHLELLRSRFQKVAYLVLSVGSALLLGSLGILFVANRRLGIEGFFLAAVVSQGVVALAGTIVNRSWLRFRLDFDRLRELLRFGLPFVPTALTLVLMRFADRLIVQRLLGLDELGLYAIGVRVAGVFDLVGTAFAMAWFPHAMKSLQEPDAKQVLRDDFPRVLWMLAFVSGAFCSVADWLVWAFIDPKFWIATAIVPPLVLASFLQTLNYPLGIGIYASKRTGFVLIPTILGSIVSLVGCYVLAKVAGLTGVAWSVPIGACAYLGSSFLISHRLYAISYDLRKAAVIMSALLAWIVVLAWLSATATPPTTSSIATRMTMIMGMLALGSMLGVIPGISTPLRFRRRAA
ncbi:MAG: lipopolysaccharide biosynthesis protein [Vicinamibacteria bacterium]